MIKNRVILQLTINVKQFTLTKKEMFLMETKMDKKINTIGKIGRIFTTIIAVFMILAAAATAVGIGVAASLPKDALAVEVTGTADVTAKGQLLGKIAGAVIDASEGGNGKIYIDDEQKIAIGDFRNSVPEGVTAEETGKGFTLNMDKQMLNLNVDAVIYALAAALVNTVCTIIVLFMIRALMKALERCDTPFCDDVIKRMKHFGYSLIPFAFISGLSENVWHYLLSPGVDVHFGIDLTVVFGILVVFMLTMIFTYGAALQKESDETI